MLRLVNVLGLVVLLVVALGCERPIPVEGDDESYYAQGESESEDGTGRFYMGREIAHSKDIDSIDWLERPERETAELPQRVVKGLELSPADNVVDMGARTGYFTFRISKKVPEGAVYAVELNSSLRDRLLERKQEMEVENVTIPESTFSDPELPAGEIDVAVFVSSYHEFTHPREMGGALLEALRPNGKLVVVEYRGEDSTIPVSDVHRMSEEQVRKEFEEVGFRWRETRDFLPQQHFIVFDKPDEEEP